MHDEHEWFAANFDEEMRVAQSVHLSISPDAEEGSINEVLVAVLRVQSRIIGLLSCIQEEGPVEDALRASRNNLLGMFDALLANVKRRPDLMEERDIAMVQSALDMVHHTREWLSMLPVEVPENAGQEEPAMA